MNECDLIERILSWAETKRWFDTSFVESCESDLEHYGRLTDNQISALENIIERFHIP